MKEIWKAIEGYEGLYEISNFGRVKSLERSYIAGKGAIIRKQDAILSASISSNGYKYVSLCRDGIASSKRLHILVWNTFGDEPSNGRKLQVDHKNEDKLDNHIDNLQLLTNRENIIKSIKLNKNMTSGFIGVCWHKQAEKWVARIEFNGSGKHLGSFNNEYDAHLAYQNKLTEIKKLGYV